MIVRIMGYSQWWKILESLIIELRKKHVTISPDVMTSLRSAKTMISIYQSDPSCVDPIPVIENDLIKLESGLMNMAKEEFGQKFAKEWLEKLEKARREAESKVELSSHFIPGVPKSKHWIRVLPSDEILRKDVEELASQMELSIKMQKDDYMLVYGNEAAVKAFVKKMAERCRRTSKN